MIAGGPGLLSDPAAGKELWGREKRSVWAGREILACSL